MGERHGTLGLLAATVAVVACAADPGDPAGDPSPGGSGGGPVEVPTNPCADPGELYTYTGSTSRDLVPMEERSTLVIYLGFQGFQMARTSVRTPALLRSDVPVKYVVQIDGVEPITGQQLGVSSTPNDDETYQSDEIDLFFNDVPVADLVGRTARVRIDAATRTCIVRTEGLVVLGDESLPPGH